MSLIVLFSGALLIAMRVSTGSWAPVLGHSLPAVASAAVAVVLVVCGVLGIFLGQKINAGSRTAGILAIAMSVVLLTPTLIHALLTWKGLYELLFCVFLLINSIYAFVALDESSRLPERPV